MKNSFLKTFLGVLMLFGGLFGMIASVMYIGISQIASTAVWIFAGTAFVGIVLYLTSRRHPDNNAEGDGHT